MDKDCEFSQDILCFEITRVSFKTKNKHFFPWLKMLLSQHAITSSRELEPRELRLTAN
jgi:hypothetical protein